VTFFVQHAANTQGRDFLVGDIHGQYDLLMKAMAASISIGLGIAFSAWAA